MRSIWKRVRTKYNKPEDTDRLKHLRSSGFHVPEEAASTSGVFADPRSRTHPLASVWLRLDILQEPYQLRLVYIEPVERDNDPLKIELGGATLRQDHASIKSCLDEYYAISYTWGSEPHDHHVVLRGCRIPVTKSCFDVLHSIRRELRSAIVWIDQLCINQQDWALRERSQQIELMREIYKSAKAVLVWTGTPALTGTNLQTAIETMDYLCERFGNYSVPRPKTVDLNEAALQSLLDLFDSRYFTRKWIVQEIAVNKNILICFDKMYCEFDRVVESGKVLTQLVLGQITLHGVIREPVLERLCELQSISFGAFVTELGIGTSMVRQLELFELLRSTELLKTLRPHDAIYALRSLASDRHALPAVDYEETCEELCLEHTIYFLNNGYATGVLLCAGWRPDRSIQAPSWCIDLTTRFQFSTIGIYCPDSAWEKNAPRRTVPEGSRCFRIQASKGSVIKETTGELADSLERQAGRLLGFAAAYFSHVVLTDQLLSYLEQLSHVTHPDGLREISIKSQFHDLEELDAYLRLLAAVSRLSKHMQRVVKNQLFATSESPLADERSILARTSDGRMGLVPPSTKVDDAVVYLRDLPMPSVVRKIGEEEHLLIGTCYFLDMPEVAHSKWGEIVLI